MGLPRHGETAATEITKVIRVAVSTLAACGIDCRSAPGGATANVDAAGTVASATWTGAAPSVDSPGRAPTATPFRRDSVRVQVAATPPVSWVMHESEPLAPSDTEARPVTVLFHGICADDTWTCDWLQYFEMAPQWQLCPRAPVACNSGGFQWTASAAVTRRLVEESVATAKARHGDRVREDATILAGFSQGSYAVVALVHDLARRPGSTLHVTGILVQGASVRFLPADVRALGARVALAAGDLDAAAPAMRAEAERLERAGVDARYMSLGTDEGHFLSVSTGKAVARIVDWLRAP
jgi:predicted esterase